LILGIFALAGTANAVPLLLNDTNTCGSLTSSLGVSAVGDVTGNLGGATGCWGEFDGNDPGPSGDGFIIDGTTYDFLAKDDGDLSGTDIGLNIISLGDTSGTWAFDADFSGDAFLIVLKAASQPGYGVWLFDGAAASSTSGTWTVAWGAGLSHFAVYAGDPGDPPDPPTISEPGILSLMAFGLLLLGLGRRRTRS